jgi:hypothetical protein
MDETPRYGRRVREMAHKEEGRETRKKIKGAKVCKHWNRCFAM